MKGRRFIFPHRKFFAQWAALGTLLACAAAPVMAQETPEARFWAACRNGDVAATRDLLDKGMNVNLRFEGGTTPLTAAAMRGQAEVVKLLLERGADPDLRDDTFKTTALGMATFFGHMEVVQVLLPRSKDDLDLVLKFGAMVGAPPLVEAGLKGKVKPQDLTIAWILAKRSKKEDLVALLEKAGAQPPPTLTADDLRRFAGVYRNAQSAELEVELRDGKLVGSGGLGFGSFFEQEFVAVSPAVLFVGRDPFTIFTFEGSGSQFERVTVAASGSSYVVTRSKGATQ
jgi:hypothetical protein